MKKFCYHIVLLPCVLFADFPKTFLSSDPVLQQCQTRTLFPQDSSCFVSWLLLCSFLFYIPLSSFTCIHSFLDQSWSLFLSTTHHLISNPVSRGNTLHLLPYILKLQKFNHKGVNFLIQPRNQLLPKGIWRVTQPLLS